MAVAFDELSNSPRLTFDEQGVSAVRELICAWDDRIDVVRAFLGTRTSIGAVAMASFQDFPTCLASTASVEPYSPDLSPNQTAVDLEIANSYGDKPAKVTINFKTKQYSSSPPRDDMPAVEDGTFLSYSMRFGTSFTTIPGRGFVWEDDLTGATKKVPEDIVGAIREPLVEHRLTWHKVARPPWGAIRAKGGLVNSAAFVGAAAETMMFDGADADIEYEIDPDQPATYRLTYVFKEKATKRGSNTYGWNHKYRASDGMWKKIKLKDDTTKGAFDTTDFTDLFRYEV